MENSGERIDYTAEFDEALLKVQAELNEKGYEWVTKNFVEGECQVALRKVDEMGNPTGIDAVGTGKKFDKALRDAINQLDEKVQ